MSKTAFIQKPIILQKGDHVGNAAAFLRVHPRYRHLRWHDRWGLSLPVRTQEGRWTLGPGLVCGEPDDSILAFLHTACRKNRSRALAPFNPSPSDVRHCVWALEAIVRACDQREVA